MGGVCLFLPIFRYLFSSLARSLALVRKGTKNVELISHVSCHMNIVQLFSILRYTGTVTGSQLTYDARLRMMCSSRCEKRS